MRGLLGILLCVPLLFWSVARSINDIQFNRAIEGHLERAANANTVPLAQKELGVALDGMRAWGLTEGYTSILYRTPDEDLGYWYTNLSQALTELENMSATAAPLERSNVLMKLRETISESGSKGASRVTVPEGASIYPHNGAYLILGVIGFACFVAGIACLVSLIDDI